MKGCMFRYRLFPFDNHGDGFFILSIVVWLELKAFIALSLSLCLCVSVPPPMCAHTFVSKWNQSLEKEYIYLEHQQEAYHDCFVLTDLQLHSSRASRHLACHMAES